MNTSCELVIVDDEKRVLEALERELRLEFGNDRFTVACFVDPASCIDYVQAHAGSVFLVISDLRMPEMRGSDLLGAVRALDADIQTVLLTAYVDVEDIMKAVSTSLQGLLLKPWTRENLVGEVEKALAAWTMKRENRRLTGEIDRLLSMAGEFQRTLFAANVPARIGSCSFDVTFMPLSFLHCGGDFYDVIPVEGGGCCMILLGDVTGHGPKSAMVAVMMKGTVQAAIAADHTVLTSPDLLLTSLNDRVCAALSRFPDVLVALTACYVDQAHGTVSIATAGQPPAFLIADGAAEPITTGNPMLGAETGRRFRNTERPLGPGDRLVLYTDGLTEAVDSATVIPPEIMQRTLAKTPATSSDLVEHFRTLLPGSQFHDDVTVITIARSFG